MKRKYNPKKVLAELQRRDLKRFSIEDFCFDKQIAFIRDTSRFKVATCSRRAGKTIACAADLVDTAKNHPDTTCLYITLSRNNAKKIIWRELLNINDEYKLGGKINETDLSITFPNKSVIYLAGAKDAKEIEKFRGLALKKVYIDEAQSFRAYIKELIDDVIVPSLYDHNGTLVLIGTPAPICAGTFYEANRGANWSKHHWTILDNPHILLKSGKEPAEILREERERRGISETDPTYLRESLGQWVNDVTALVYQYNPTINVYTQLPDHDWNYIFGIDLGHDDADAIAVIAYSHTSRAAYLVEEHVKTKQTISDLAAEIRRLEAIYKPVKMVADTGGLGKKIVEELKQRWSLPVEAAEKSRKLEYIELFNDALRTGNFLIKADSIAAHDYTMIQWDSKISDKRKISDTFHSDISDAILYAWREAKNFVQIDPPKTKLTPTEEIDLWEEAEDARINSRNNTSWWEDL